MKTHIPTLVASLPSLVERLPHEREFFKSGLDKFNLVIIPDDADTSDKDEPNYCAVLPESYFDECASTPELMLVHYLHLMGHKLCEQYWHKCPVPYSTFSKNERDFIEELYIQRMFLMLGGTLHSDFFDCVAKFEKYRDWANPSYRLMINTLFLEQPMHTIDSGLLQLHKELYGNNPFHQSTFNVYMMICRVLKDRYRLSDIVELYESINVVAEK